MYKLERQKTMEYRNYDSFNVVVVRIYKVFESIWEALRTFLKESSHIHD